MSGHVSGVATRFQSSVEGAIFTHCYSHKLNLVLHDLVKNVRIISEIQDFVKELYNFIALTPKRLVTFQTIQNQLIYDEDNDFTLFESLKKLCPTRFTCRTSAYKAIFTNYKPLLDVLESLCYESGETGSKSSILFDKLTSFNIMFEKSLRNRFSLRLSMWQLFYKRKI